MITKRYYWIVRIIGKVNTFHWIDSVDIPRGRFLSVRQVENKSESKGQFDWIITVSKSSQLAGTPLSSALVHDTRSVQMVLSERTPSTGCMVMEGCFASRRRQLNATVRLLDHRWSSGFTGLSIDIESKREQLDPLVRLCHWMVANQPENFLCCWMSVALEESR